MRRRGGELLPSVAGALGGLALGLAPVAVVYRQTIARRARDWTEVSAFLPRPADILNVQPGNILWHHLLYRTGIANLEGRPGAEVALGFTPFVLVATGVGLAIVLRLSEPTADLRLAFGLLAAPLLAWLLTVQVGTNTAWHVVWQALPGASGIRTPFRVQVASVFFLCLGLAIAMTRGVQAARSSGRRWTAACLAGLAGLCVVEQANSALPAQSKAEARHWMLAAHRPAFACDVFYLLPQTPAMLPWPTRQADAMLLSQVIGMPTVNGNSSYAPFGWDLFEPDRAGYRQKVRAWIAAHAGGATVCGADPRSGRWEPGISPPPPAPAPPQTARG